MSQVLRAASSAGNGGNGSNYRPVWLILMLMMLLIGCDAETSRTHVSNIAVETTSASSSGVPGSGFNGVFHSHDGARRILNLSERSGRITGVLGSAAIDAKLQDSESHKAIGDLKDPGTGTSLGTVELSLEEDRVILAMTVMHSENQQGQVLPPATFVRGAPPPVQELLDAQLVGRWRQAVAVDPDRVGDAVVWLVLHPDGSVEHGRGGSRGELGVLAASSDEGFSGRWRTEDQVLHVLPTGSGHWVAFARYAVDGQKLRLTYNSGTTQNYHRQ